ncbi:MAG: Glycosyl transferase family 2 [Parcubacteria group bacterium GW2011_GWE2_39_37]|uniref:Glycosyl transferase family 2 n=1 Tax=Candidatus Falkowbacteria bacterium GW2011_GWF2_39_8 TaxID=1618642 RepID=A0A0G0SGW1_9BACT|nr:MAG: Glycosyl transferase family 2 [Parcubacteria group bacterium GW2011_GWE2_39_37]KKR33940.1 MAG: Glycosyl transferase family 2 [Candidatus Falkowbacteria bacterium GW2011_GWF2_39_8]
MKLSVIIPVFNEEKTIEEILSRVNEVPLEKEIIIVDDGSFDETRNILKRIEQAGDATIKIFFSEKNQGKGMAIREGIKLVEGDLVIIQDADLEYDPMDYPRLVQPIIDGRSQVVYGSRNLLPSNSSGRKLYKYGGVFLSKLANLLYGLEITDEATCYKVFTSKALKSLDLKCKQFEFCPEVTAKLAKQGYNFIEVPINYYPRNHNQGKKLKLRDGIKAVWTLIKYRFVE